MPKKPCNYCSMHAIDYTYGPPIRRGADYFENSFEGFIREFPQCYELVIGLNGSREESVSIEYCPWCGRKLENMRGKSCR